MTTKLLTANQVADIAGTSVKTVRRRMQDGTLPTVRFGRLVRVDEQALKQWIEAGGQGYSTDWAKQAVVN